MATGERLPRDYNTTVKAFQFPFVNLIAPDRMGDLVRLDAFWRFSPVMARIELDAARQEA